MKKCAFLSMDSLNKLGCSDYLLIEPMKEIGWSVTEISWQDKYVNWNDYDAVIIRSTWNYQDYCEEFLQVLEKIDLSTALLMNSLSLVKWNVNKNYLLTLEKKGITIIPTIWGTSYLEALLLKALDQFKSEKLIIKPCVSANADDTFILNKDLSSENNKQALSLFSEREFMLQPFMPNIVDEGEFSLFYFNGQLSHSVLKKPKQHDFRVQEEHGGVLFRIEPEAKLLEAGIKALNKIPHSTLYARLDFVRHGDEFAMMEAELIEPSLYFNVDKESPVRFANAFVRYYETHKAEK
jgi:glutathione synthase/RimK-type ligase-like ATP-grasp enzyme